MQLVVVVVDSVSLVTRIEFSENAEVQLQDPEGARRDQREASQEKRGRGVFRFGRYCNRSQHNHHYHHYQPASQEERGRGCIG